jgi:hypothetical protein
MTPKTVAYAASAWALAFAAIGFYWAAGGTALLDTIGGEVERKTRARDSDFLAIGWASNGLKLIAAALVLALVRPFGERLPRRAIAALIAVGGVLLVLYETAELAQHLLMAMGAIDRNGLDDTAVYGHLLFWDPWWIFGGVLFALAGWRNRPVTVPARP